MSLAGFREDLDVGAASRYDGYMAGDAPPAARYDDIVAGPGTHVAARLDQDAPGVAFDDLDLAAAYREYRPVILAYLRRRTGDAALAEELAQDVFLAALVARPSLSNAGRPLLAWLYAVARRRAIDAARSARQRACAPLEEAPSGDVIDDGRISARAIADGIRALPPAQQRVVLLRLVSGLSFAEIGIALGADAAVCRVRFSRALRALRGSLEQAVLAVAVAIAKLGNEGLDTICGCV